MAATSSVPSRAFARAAVLVAGAALAAFAQYTGPSEGRAASEPLRTVAEVLEQGRDDQPVLLTGVLAKKVGKEKYLFRDATGEIRVEIDVEDFPAGPVDATTRVEIAGEVDKNVLRKAEVDAKRVRVLPAE